ncbi:hypothetical protein GMOD_00008021 [Pyrenophora seminiperda CCB06]|uniref:Uncharacterized protein n=1 Tax=Pyrenophora seminiperda CCB06 TaxID=1302712 RepID=A0A3M7MG96_9PLEO|nr:hypothetical protein GMOD_00008021 [Pyrenophora seminiperda CCB06]
MPQFFDLPRELRDLIYVQVLTLSASLPTLKETRYPFKWYPLKQPPRGLTGYDCVMSFQEAPPTCASFLACNRQINVEMMQAIRREKQNGQLCALMDCIVNEQMLYFTWLAVPLVKTEEKDDVAKWMMMGCKGGSSTPMSKYMRSWVARLLYYAGTRHVPLLGSKVVSSLYSYQPFFTSIERFWINIRLFETSPSDADARGNSTSWAVCAALSHVFDTTGPRTTTARRVDFIQELVLNVVPQTHSLSNTEEAPRHDTNNNNNDSLFVPETETETEESKTPTEEIIRNELVDVWNKIWAADNLPTSDLRARHCRFLLEKIDRVRICVDGETFRTRELAAELERGRAAMRRIQMR